jgi:1-aminocyclopropane-1-carboxylate deaminase
MPSINKSILQPIDLPEFKKSNVEVITKRDDLIHPEISGNKLRKLKYNIEHMIEINSKGILTFGGAYSNHLLATAALCNKKKIPSIGIVRGDELTTSSNNTLKRCTELNMQLLFVSRNEYKKREDIEYLNQIQVNYPNYWIVPEGGANQLGIKGCSKIMKETSNDFDGVFLAQGTTTTSCGILLSLPKNTRLHAVPVLKGFDSLSNMQNRIGNDVTWKSMKSQIEIHSEYHFGGYGKYTKDLLEFIRKVSRETNLPLDPVYTGKAFYALFDNVINGKLNNKRILFIHTGGLKTLDSIESRENITLHY